jgi:hypothetical protein
VELTSWVLSDSPPVRPRSILVHATGSSNARPQLNFADSPADRTAPVAHRPGKWRNGRRARFRSVCPEGREGSTPSFPTTEPRSPTSGARAFFPLPRFWTLPDPLGRRCHDHCVPQLADIASVPVQDVHTDQPSRSMCTPAKQGQRPSTASRRRRERASCPQPTEGGYPQMWRGPVPRQLVAGSSSAWASSAGWLGRPLGDLGSETALGDPSRPPTAGRRLGHRSIRHHGRQPPTRGHGR